MKYIIFIFPLLLSTKNAIGQMGCTDPQASNYDATATENDGSCFYPTTTYQLTEVTQLPSNFEEASGAIFFNENLWIQEDAGNEDRIYQIDSLTGITDHLVTIANADNYDWEDLAADENHVYIGDFGNNDGNRTNLRIYKIPKAETAGNVANSEVIEFTFSDQTDFSVNNNNNNFDCEALFVFEDSLHLFSKNWVDFKTRHYVLPTTAGEHVAELRDSLEVQAQITAADINEQGDVVLLGYNTTTSEVLMWLLFDYPDNQFFKGNKRKIGLGSAINTSQTEGIAFRDAYTGYVVSEKFSVLPQKLLRFNIQQFLEAPNAVEESDFLPEIKIYPNPFQDFLTIQIPDLKEPIEQIRLLDVRGKVVEILEKETLVRKEEVRLNLKKGSGVGVYFIEIQTVSGVLTKKVIKK